MSKRKTIFKTFSVILSLLILLAVTPLGVSATVTTQMMPDAVTGDVIVGNEIAGATSLEDLSYENEPVKVLNGTSWVNVTPSDNEAIQSQVDYSLNTTVTDNGDGTCTMELYDYPVKFINAVGEVEDISLEIASASNGSYKTKANDIQIVFPKKISDGISLSGKGVSVKLKPFVSTGLSSNVSSTINTTHITVDATVTKLDNETVSYYYDNKTTLEYSLTYTGFKEDIVVSEYTGQTEYTFLLETGGLTLTKIDESYYLTDENGEIKATLGDIIIFTADERNNALGSMTHITVRENQQYLITIHIDAEYLRDEKTVYPIRIDPTIEITYDNNGTGAIHDVTVNSTAGSSGSSGSVYVGKRNTYGISRTLMKFPGLNLSAIPSNSTINSAYIEIRDLLCETTSMTVNAAMFVGYEWNESTANWDNTQPHIYTRINSGSINVSYSNGASLSQKHRYSINITQAIRLWKSGLFSQSKGIILKADDSVENGSSELYKTFASYNRASNKPSLKINYTSNVTHTAYGWLGFVNSAVVNGWVWCSDHQNESLDVVLIPTNTATNESWFSIGPANIYRSDVQDAGYGTGNYGFSCAMNDWTAFPPGTYSVAAVAILPSGQTYTLHASPKTYVHSLIRLNKTELSLDIGQTATLTASAVSDSVSLDNLVWSSSDTSVATVNGNGKVTAVRGGTSLITVTDGSSSASCTVKVLKRAIIIVPGVMGTELKLAADTYLLSAGTKVWPPYEEGDNLQNLIVIDNTLNKLMSLKCDDDGNSVNNLVVNNVDNYGAFDTYKELYVTLQQEFGNVRDIVFFGYDWRQPNDVSGQLLKNKIVQYDSVIVIAHSMGGLVTSHMLTDPVANTYVEKVITLGTPYLGSLEMLPILSHGHYDYIDTALEDLWSPIASVAKESLLYPMLQDIAVNIPSMYELLPTEKYFSLDNRYYYSIEGTDICTTFEMTRYFLPCARDKQVNGLFNLNLFDAATSNHALLWQNNSHVTQSVDTYYVVGEEKATICTYDFKYGILNNPYNTTSVTAGDGTVLSYSAAINDLYSSKTYFVNANHNSLVDAGNILDFIKNIVYGNMNLTTGMRKEPNIPL